MRTRGREGCDQRHAGSSVRAAGEAMSRLAERLPAGTRQAERHSEPQTAVPLREGQEKGYEEQM